MDAQSVEIIGRNQLIAQLLRAGVDVALPLRDRGLDLIAYVDTGEDVAEFRAVPIQMKASSGRGFGIHRKYDRFPSLLIAHVWDVHDAGRTTTYALTQAEAVAVGDAMGWTRTRSWKDQSGYSTRHISPRLQELLDPYLMSPETWRSKVMGQVRGVDRKR